MSFSSRFAVEDGAIAHHAANLDTSQRALDEALRRFDASLAALPGVWRGASFASFQEVQTRWRAAGSELNRALGDIRSRVAATAVTYDAGEADQAQALRQVGHAVDWSAGSFRH